MICAGLALLGFGSAGYARGTAPAAAAAADGSCESSVVSSARLSVGTGFATAAFTLADGCTGVAVSLVSYTAAASTFDPAQQQVLFKASSVTAPAGAHTLTVELPPCFFQADFVFGAPLQTLGPEGTGNFYGDQGRLILAWTGGSGPCATSTTSTTVTAPTTTAPNTATTTVPPATTATPSTQQVTTSTVPSVTTATPGTTTAVAQPPTTVSTSTSTTTAATTTTGAVGSPTTTRGGGGPFTPPPGQPSHSTPAPHAKPPLPFTGLSLRSLIGLGLALLVGGLLIRFLARGGRGLLVPAMPYTPAVALRTAALPRRLDVAAQRFDYRVFVPGVGSGASIDEAEQSLLDRRWARFGSPTLGSPGRRRAPTD